MRKGPWQKAKMIIRGAYRVFSIVNPFPTLLDYTPVGFAMTDVVPLALLPLAPGSPGTAPISPASAGGVGAAPGGTGEGQGRILF